MFQKLCHQSPKVNLYYETPWQKSCIRDCAMRRAAKYIIISYDKVVDITTNEYQAWARNHVKTFNLWTYLVILTNSWRKYQMSSTFPPPHNTHHHNHLPTFTLHSPRVQTSQPTVNILFVKYISTSTKFVQRWVSWTKVNKDKQR